MFERKWVLLSGLIFCASGLVVLGWMYFFTSSEGRWQIDVRGTETIKKEDISEVVLYLLQKEQGKVELGEIEAALLLNPRIAKVSTRISGRQVVQIDIEEKNACCYVHEGFQIQELGDDGHVLEEDRTSLPGGIAGEMPIFYLTGSEEEKKELETVKRDIISLWKETMTSHAFLWERISEIELSLKLNEISVFPVAARAKVRMSAPFDRSRLSRLWAVFFFLEREQEIARRWNEISLTDKNAVIRETGNNGG